METNEKTPFEGWVILELMGHRRLAGFLREEALGGTSFLRIGFYSGSAVYCITPTTEAIAKKVAASSRPEPVTAWELRPERTLPARATRDDDEDDDDGDEAPY